MKTTLLLIVAVFVFGLGTAQAESTQKNYTPEQIRDMPRFSSIEQQRCPKARYPSVKKRLECKHEVRIELYEKRQKGMAEKTG